MSNKRKLGLTHYPLDVDVFDDEKLVLAEELLDPSGFNTPLRGLMAPLLIHLYCIIYKSGYHIKWDITMQVAISRRMSNGMTPTNVTKMVNALVDAKLFDAEYFGKGILTSKRLQETWLTVVVKARRVHQTIEPELCMLSKSEIAAIKHPKSNPATEKGKNVAEPQQSATGTRIAPQAKLGETGRSGPNKPKNVTETGNNVAGSHRLSTKKTKESSKSHANSPKNGVSVTDISNTASETIENDAETAIPFAFNNNNREYIDNIGNDYNGENSDDAANNGENVAETGEPATEIDENDTEDVLGASFMKITAADKGFYGIENCYLNYITPEYSTTFQQHCMRFHFSPDKMQRWAQAFNRKLISEGTTQAQMQGNGWLRYMMNWIATVDDYPTVDPDILFTNKHIKQNNNYAGKRSANGSNATNGGTGAGQQSKFGGVSQESIDKLLASQKPH